MNTIGIDNNLDWNRIRHLLKLGIFAAAMVLVGDMLLGYGIADGSLSGAEALLSKYMDVSDRRIFWSALLGMIGIPLECLCYFAIYRMMADASPKHAHAYRSGILGMLMFGGCGVHVSCCVLVYYAKKMKALGMEDAMGETMKFAKYFLLPATTVFFIFFLLTVILQMHAFMKGVTPLPKWCAVFTVLFGIAASLVCKCIGNYEITNALRTGWISIGNLWMFGGLLWASKKYAACFTISSRRS